MSKEAIKNMESFIKQFDEKDLFLQIYCDAKGYIFAKPEIADQVEGFLKQNEIELYRYDNKPLDKMIGEKNYDKYIQFAYLQIYDFGLRRISGYENMFENEINLVRAFNKLDLIEDDKGSLDMFLIKED